MPSALSEPFPLPFFFSFLACPRVLCVFVHASRKKKSSYQVAKRLS